MDRFKLIKKLGRGSYGSALLAERLSSKGLVVIKRVDMSEMDEPEKKQAMTEAALLNVLRHPSVIAYEEAFIEDDHLHIVMEHAAQGDLQKAVRSQRKKDEPFPEARVLRWTAELALALQHIHANNVLHRDLKTANCFLLESDDVKVGDFGIARVLERTTAQASTQIGTPYFLSPEAVSAKPYGRASDIWGLGCIVFEVCALRRVFSASSLLALVYKIVNDPVPAIPACYSPELRELVAAMLNKDPEQRPSASDILDRPVMRRTLQAILAEPEAGEGFRPDAAAPATLPDAGLSPTTPLSGDSSGGSAVGFAEASGSGAASLSGETRHVGAGADPVDVFGTARGAGDDDGGWVGSLGADEAEAGGAPSAGEEWEEYDDEYEDDFLEVTARSADGSPGGGAASVGAASGAMSPSSEAAHAREARARGSQAARDLRSAAAEELRRGGAAAPASPAGSPPAAPSPGSPAPAAGGAAAAPAPRDRPLPRPVDLGSAVRESRERLIEALGEETFLALLRVLMPIAEEGRQPRPDEIRTAMRLAPGDDDRARRRVRDAMEVHVFNEARLLCQERAAEPGSNACWGGAASPSREDGGKSRPEGRGSWDEGKEDEDGGDGGDGGGAAAGGVGAGVRRPSVVPAAAKDRPSSARAGLRRLLGAEAFDAVYGVLAAAVAGSRGPTGAELGRMRSLLPPGAGSDVLMRMEELVFSDATGGAGGGGGGAPAGHGRGGGSARASQPHETPPRRPRPLRQGDGRLAHAGPARPQTTGAVPGRGGRSRESEAPAAERRPAAGAGAGGRAGRSGGKGAGTGAARARRGSGEAEEEEDYGYDDDDFEPVKTGLGDRRVGDMPPEVGEEEEDDDDDEEVLDDATGLADGAQRPSARGVVVLGGGQVRRPVTAGARRRSDATSASLGRPGSASRRVHVERGAAPVSVPGRPSSREARSRQRRPSGARRLSSAASFPASAGASYGRGGIGPAASDEQ